jgi:hypothetical protein
MKKNVFLSIILLIPFVVFAQVILISEDFNGATQPPNWHQDNFGTGTQLWTFGSKTMPLGTINFDTNVAIFNDDASGNTGNHDLVWLWHDAIDLTNCSVFTIAFDYAIDPMSNDKFMWAIWDTTNYSWIPFRTYTSSTDNEIVVGTNYFFTHFSDILSDVYPNIDISNIFIGFGFDDIDSDKSWGVGIDNVIVEIWFYPPNNEAINAISINYGDIITGNIRGTTLVEIVEDCDETPENPSSEVGLWYKFIGNGESVTLSTCYEETHIDSSLNIYTGSPGDLLCNIGNNNDPNCSEYQSIIEDFQTIAGITYYVKLATYESFTHNDGNYKFTLTCDSMAILQTSISGFEMFPNPVKDILNLSSDNKLDSIIIYNILGQEVFTTKPDKTQIKINTSTLQSGSYVVKVVEGKQMGSYSFIKE